MFSYFAGPPFCLHVFLVLFRSVSFLMVVLVAFPGTCSAGVPFRHIKVTAVACIPIIPFFVVVVIVHQPGGTCHNGFLQRDPAAVFPRHCIFLTNRFTSYDYHHSNNLRKGRVLHALSATGMNSRPEPPPNVSIPVSRHPHGCRREGSAACTSVEGSQGR